MSISLSNSSIRGAVVLVAFVIALAAFLVLASCATNDAPRLCAGSASHPRADDPYVEMLMREGLSLKSAQEKTSINRINGCP